MADLIFCIKQPVADSCFPHEAVLIPRDSDIVFEDELAGYTFADIGNWLTVNDHKDLKSQLDELWEGLEKAKAIENIEHFKYVGSIMINSLIYWRFVIKKALEIYTPETVYIPEACYKKNVTIFSREQFLEWAYYQVLREEVKTYTYKTFIEKTQKKELSLRTYFKPRFDNFLDLIYLSSKLPSSLLGWIRKSKNYESVQSKILIISQPSKTIGLMKLLSGRKDYSVWPVNKIVNGNHLYGDIRKTPLVITEQTSAFSGWAAYMDKFIDNVAASYPAIEKFADREWEILITDHETDPYILYLVDEFRKRNKSIAFIPEGAQHHNNGTFEFYPYGHYLKPEITKMLLSQSEMDFWKARQIPNELLVTGYMANTFSYSKLLGSIISMFVYLRQILRGSRRKKIIFLSVEIFTDIVGVHLGSITSFQQVDLFTKLLQNIDFSKFTVLAKGKNPFLTNILRERYKKSDILFTNHLSWQIQANIADVVIATNSSISIESISLGRPLIIWNDTSLPSYADNFSSEKNDTVRKISDRNEIQKILTEIIQGPKNDFKQYDYYFEKNSQHKVINWIDEKLKNKKNA